MAHMTQAFHLQHENMLTLMAALQQLNAAEESDSVHEVSVSQDMLTILSPISHMRIKSYTKLY